MHRIGLLFVALAAASVASAQPSGQLHRFVASSGGARLCLDVPARQVGVGLTAHACHGGDNQQFKLDYRSDGNYYLVRVFNDGTCLAGGGDRLVVAAPCDGSDRAQRWWRSASGQFQNQLTSKCADIQGGSTANGTPVLMWGCHDGWNQRWSAEAVGTAPQGPAAPQPTPTLAFADWARQRLQQGGSYDVGRVAGQLFAAGGGNVIAPGGGNVVSAGGANLTPEAIAAVIAPGGGNVVSAGGANVVSAGGLNLRDFTQGLIAAGGGNLISTGGLNIADAVTAEVVRRGVEQSLRQPDAVGRLIAAGGGNLVSPGALASYQRTATAPLIAAGGGNLLSFDAAYFGRLQAGIIAPGGGTLIAAGGGNLQSLADGVGVGLAAGLVSENGLGIQQRANLANLSVAAFGSSPAMLQSIASGLRGPYQVQSAGALNGSYLLDQGVAREVVDALVAQGLATVPAPVVVSNPTYQAPSSPSPTSTTPPITETPPTSDPSPSVPGEGPDEGTPLAGMSATELREVAARATANAEDSERRAAEARSDAAADPSNRADLLRQADRHDDRARRYRQRAERASRLAERRDG